MRSLLLAYLLWLVGGPLSLHKFYLGRPVVGLLYFFTGGLFLLGWIVDFFTLPRQVLVANLLRQNRAEGLRSGLRRELETLKGGLYNVLESGAGASKSAAWWEPLKKLLKPHVTDADLMLALLRAAQKHGGCLSVTTGVMETGVPFADVERVLKTMVDSGYVYMDNDATTGVVVYVFKEIF
jgi:TM2 domain-containing membrane protein YozV